MNTIQTVELYDNALTAKYDMLKHIRDGWRVHTCTMSAYLAGYHTYRDILVVYEREC